MREDMKVVDVTLKVVDVTQQDALERAKGKVRIRTCDPL